MSRYPLGVTGNEYDIAGPDYEVESDARCPFVDMHGESCGAETFEQGYGDRSWLVCNAEDSHTTDLEPVDAYDGG